MVPSESNKVFRRNLRKQKVHMKAESGTCNVCSAPCSSCLHVNRSFMPSKTGDSPDETSGENNTSYSISNKRSIGNRGNASEASNMIDGTSGGNISVEQCESGKAILMTAKSENISLEGHGDNILCINGAGTNQVITKMSGSAKSDVETISPMEPQKCSLQTKEVMSGSLKDGGDFEEASAKSCPKLKVNIENNDPKIPAEVLDSAKLDQECDKVGASSVLPYDPKEASSKFHVVDENDESDIVEQDVKVCDICGDAGREDLLAVCSRCSDGAEHTYCMRERIDKVPEGYWLCEECRLEDETKEEQKKQVSAIVEKAQSSARKASDVYGNKTSKDCTTGAKVSCKRPAEEIEVSSSSAKKQAFESTTKDSPKTSSPSRTGALSRDSSFKNLDRGKVKPAHHFHSSTRSVDDNLETAFSPTTAPRSQTPRGASLSKSSSFNFTNRKPKVKLVDDVPHKLKSIKESISSVDTKEGTGRVISKSTSFKSSGYAGRLYTGESKVKMLSPKSSLVQDPKGVKHTKEQSTCERKNSFKSDCPSINSSSMTSSAASTAIKVDQKPSRAETASVLSRRGSEVPSLLGDSKRQLSNPLEQKPIHLASPKYDSLANSVASDKSNVNNLNPQDELLPRHHTVRIKESSTTRPKQQGIGRSVVPSEKCKDTAHSPHFPTVDSSRSDVKSSREAAINKGNKLKAALEAAMLKKPVIYNRKNKVTEQSEDKSEVLPSQEHRATSLYTRNPRPAPEDVGEGQAINGGSYKQTTGNLLSRNASEAISALLKTSAIPEQEYVWQGSFEVNSIGKPPIVCDGFQAHLSNCASPKVVEAVNKLPHKFMFNEVPRLSTWPIQFEENGVKEDNIALYFFARDLESYDKSYKVLVDSMMRNDLALKANIDGVELLIFPSNQLPETSQRWNMFYYLWGVFRGKRVNSAQQVPSVSAKKLCIPQNTPTNIMSFADNKCSTTPVDKGLPLPTICDIATSKVHHLPDALPSTNEDSDSQKVYIAKVKDTERQDSRADSLPPLQKSSVQPRTQEGVLGTDCNVDIEQHRQPSQVIQSVNDHNGSEKIPIDLDAPFEEEPQSFAPNLNIIPAGPHEVAPTSSISEKNNIKELDSWHVNNHKKRSYTDTSSPSESASKSVFGSTGQTTKSFIDGGNMLKKQKTGFNVLYGGNEYSNSSSSIREKQREEETGVPDLNEEMYLFPVGPHQENEVDLDGKSIPWIPGLSSGEKDKPPNLELALGAETKPLMKQGGNAVMRNSNHHQVQPQDRVVAAPARNDEDDVSASLSLSLSFPSADGNRGAQLLPERRHVKQPLVLFGSFSEK